MSSYTPLSNAEIAEALKDLEGWQYEDAKLKKTYKLKDFRAAISFMVRMAFFAEELNHHPELSNVYNTVKVALTTHDAGDQVTEMDMKLAKAIESFSWV